MKRLTDCPSHSDHEGHRWKATVLDERTQMSVDFLADVPCVAYALDGDQWGSQSRRPDGVLIFEREPDGGIGFVELKGKVQPEALETPFLQIRAGVEHFSSTETHGGQHHAQWSNKDDRPLATTGRRQLPVALGPKHLTFGVIVVSRGGTRIRPQTFECDGRRCMIIAVQKHGRRGRRSLELSEVLAQAGYG